jgi:hypothetical protein
VHHRARRAAVSEKADALVPIPETARSLDNRAPIIFRGNRFDLDIGFGSDESGITARGHVTESR